MLPSLVIKKKLCISNMNLKFDFVFNTVCASVSLTNMVLSIMVQLVFLLDVHSRLCRLMDFWWFVVDLWTLPWHILSFLSCFPDVAEELRLPAASWRQDVGPAAGEGHAVRRGGHAAFLRDPGDGSPGWNDHRVSYAAFPWQMGSNLCLYSANVEKTQFRNYILSIK